MSNSVSPLHIDFSSVKRKLAEIKDMIFPPFESTVDHQGRKHCLQCYTVLPSGSNDDFCSQQCVLSYWDEFRQQYNGYSGKYSSLSVLYWPSISTQYTPPGI